ncbi:MAG: hypothetical protein AAGB22_04355 [Bacteroidota bacterium]
MAPQQEPSDQLPEFLQNLPREDGIEAPEGYFDTLGSRIRARLDEQPEAKVRSIRPRYQWMGIAAGLAALIALTVALWPQPESTTLTAEDIQWLLLEDDRGEFDEELLAALDEPEAPSPYEDVPLDSQDQEIIIEYLLEEDPDLLLEAL